jgi:hypothetical protein
MAIGQFAFSTHNTPPTDRIDFAVTPVDLRSLHQFDFVNQQLIHVSEKLSSPAGFIV